jgi:hypothetical protein
MAGGFPRDQVDELLKACHRRCCICHRFCGVKIETDHIVPSAEGGADTIDNAVPVCFECHAEIHSYNDKPPRGRKFRPVELRGHKEQWLEICRSRPELFIGTPRDADVGPLQALIDELEFNLIVSEQTSEGYWGCPFLEEQFLRAIHTGAIATLQDELKQTILNASVAIRRANQQLVNPSPDKTPSAAVQKTVKGIREAKSAIEAARDLLLQFLGSSS